MDLTGDKMKFIVVFLFSILSYSDSYSKDLNWSWYWIQGGVGSPLVYEGVAIKKIISKKEIEFSLVEKSRTLDEFKLKIIFKNNKYIANFYPPNSEKILQNLDGVKIVDKDIGKTRANERYVFFNGRTEQMLVISIN